MVGVELTNEASDAEQLQPTLADVERRLGKQPRQVVADEGYASRANVEAMQQAAVELITPAPNAAGRAQASLKRAGIDAAFGAEAFVYDETSDTYRCPAGQSMRCRRSSRKRYKQYRQYQAKGSDCQNVRCGRAAVPRVSSAAGRCRGPRKTL